MPIAIDPRQPWEYVLKSERDTLNPTVFLLKVLRVGDEAALQDKLVAVTADKETRVSSGTHQLEVLRAGLVGWSNLFTADGTEVLFKTNPGRKRNGIEQVSDESLDVLAPKVRHELSEAIIERNTVSRDEEKNF